MKSAKYIIPTFLILALFALVTTPASAQGILASPWEFRVNLYGWLPEAPATITYDDQELVDVPEDLGTILDSVEMTAMFQVEVHKGPLVLYANSIYYEGEYDDNFIGAVSGLRREWELEEEVWAIQYGAGYAFGPWDLGEGTAGSNLTLIPWVGGFWFYDDWSVKLDPVNAIFDGGKADGIFEFNTPMVGLATRFDLSARWYANIKYGYGGFGVDDVDEVYDFVGNVGYRFYMWGTPARFLAGYRYLYFDHSTSSVELEVDIKGPFLGIGWDF